jgi:GNAT superfamily N-acetyltransferase
MSTCILATANSFAVASCWHKGQLVGIGRMISDGEMYSGIFDVVIDPDFQKMGVGKKIMETLISKAPDTVIYLTSTFGNEPFYFKLGFKPHKTAMSLYPERLKGTRYLNHEWTPEQ